MNKKFTYLIIALLVSIVMLQVSSCKKTNVKGVAVDTQFALSVFSDTMSIMDLIEEIDSTSTTWLRVRNDSLFAYYGDTVKGVIKASSFLSNLEDVHFNTNTSFTVNPFEPDNGVGTIVKADKFAEFPFSYDGFDITSVLLRSGKLSFGFDVTPELESLRKIVIYSQTLKMPNGEDFEMVFDYNKNREKYEVDLTDCVIMPDSTQTVWFSADITLFWEAGQTYPGGTYNCNMSGDLENVRFKTVTAVVTKAIDSVFHERQTIDFGIKGLSGSAHLPVPSIYITYRNTFGFGAFGDITRLKFVNTAHGTSTDLLVQDTVDVDIYPTEGEYRNFRVEGFTDYIDAWAGYTRLDFDGKVSISTPGEVITLSDTSAVDIIGDIEMPFSFKLTDLHYCDTVAVNFSGQDINAGLDEVDDYFDEIDFSIEYNSKIKINMDMQVYFLRNNFLLDSLFTGTQSLEYTTTSDINVIDIEPFTGDRLKHITRANKMVLKMGARTDDISPDPVMMMGSDNLVLRIKMLSKSSEINFDGLK